MRRTSRGTARIGRMLGLVLAVGVVGCSPPKENGGGQAPPTPTPDKKTAATESGKRIKVAVVVDTGGKDDKSFNAAADLGLQRAIKELGIDGQTIESKEAADYQTNLTNTASQGSDLVVAVGTNMESALEGVAKQFPNVKFAIVDGKAPEGATNCISLQFKEEQGTFLAGFVAASVSKTKKIGFVGGQQIPLIKKFEAGYRAGAKAAGFDPDKQVLSAYTGDWVDLTKGRSQAELEFNNGADIIFHAAGKSGLGVIEAAKAKGPGFYAIGVDQDQDGEAPGRVLTSMVKHVDTAVFDTIKRVKDGQFQAGTHIYDLKEGGVGLSEMKFTRQDVPAAVQDRLKQLSELVAGGQVVPPTTLEEVAKFQPPKL
jgi:basic membrane protein A